MCDQSGRWRNRADHRECSRQRKGLNDEAAEAEARASVEANKQTGAVPNSLDGLAGTLTSGVGDE